MSSYINNLPPPWPNAALALSKVASDVKLREQIEQASESAPIKTGLQKTDVADTGSAGEASTGSAGNSGNKGVDVSV